MLLASGFKSGFNAAVEIITKSSRTARYLICGPGLSKFALLTFLCLYLAGCVTPAKHEDLQQEILQLEASVLEKDKKINELQDALKAKDEELQKKDKRIERLRKQLESFGVFE